MMVWALMVAGAAELTGAVVDPAGEPIRDVLVVAYDHRLNYELDVTDASGNFRISDLPAGERRIRLLPLDDVAAVEIYYPAGLALCSAERVDLGRNEERYLGPIVLAPGGRITGTLLRPDGAPASGVEVVARSAADEAYALSRATRTDESGAFALTGLAVESDGDFWRLEIRNAVDLPFQYFGGVFEESEGTVVELQDGVADIGIWTALVGATISGAVETADGGAAEGDVWILDAGSTRTVPLENGAFQLNGVTPGTVTLWVEAEGYARTWWPGTPGPFESLLVSDGEVLSDVVVPLGPEAVAEGRMTGAEQFSDGLVTLTSDAAGISVSGALQTDGSFELMGLSPGEWRIGLVPGEGSGLVDGDLLDEQGQPLTLVLEPGVNRLGDLSPAAGATVKGRVLDRETGNGVYGAWVYVEDIDSGITRLARSERNGRYALEGFAPGIYRVWAEFAAYCAGDPDWVARYYPDQVNPALVASIPLAPGQVSKWDPLLSEDVDQDNMGDDWERFFGLDLQRNDGEEDLDGDGYTNLEEYLLSTDPTRIATDGCGCASLPGLGRPDLGGAWMALMGWLWFRARRRPVSM